jgi:hypothetical protein
MPSPQTACVYQKIILRTLNPTIWRRCTRFFMLSVFINHMQVDEVQINGGGPEPLMARRPLRFINFASCSAA